MVFEVEMEKEVMARTESEDHFSTDGADDYDTELVVIKVGYEVNHASVQDNRMSHGSPPIPRVR